MKFSVIAFASLVALVTAQDATSTSLSPQASCAADCEYFSWRVWMSCLVNWSWLYLGDPTDICCNAVCYNVPCPDAAMANDTTACAAACPQGSGTPADTAAYAKCQQSCYSSLFLGTASGTATLPPNTATGTGVSATATATETGSGSHTRLSGSTCSLSFVFW